MKNQNPKIKILLDYLKQPRTKEQKINSYRMEYLRLYTPLVGAFPTTWFDSRFIDIMDLVIQDLYKRWLSDGLTPQEFEYTFGGGEDSELIWYLFRPTANLSTRDEDYDPPMVNLGVNND